MHSNTAAGNMILLAQRMLTWRLCALARFVCKVETITGVRSHRVIRVTYPSMNIYAYGILINATRPGRIERERKVYEWADK